MNSSELDLVKTYIHKYPAAAARELENLPVDSAQLLIRLLPEAQASRVLMQMLPTYAARLCRALPDELATELLADGNSNQIVSILRCLPTAERSAYLQVLPDKLSVLCRLLLSYSEDTIGAWMVVDTLVFPQDISAGDALLRLSDSQCVCDCNHLPVIDNKGFLKGLVSMKSLLKAHQKVLLNRLVKEVFPVLPSRISLNVAEAHKDWQEYDSMLVLNRQQQVVGLLRHQDLCAGLAGLNATAQASSTASTEFGKSILEDIGQAYLDAITALSELALGKPRATSSNKRTGVK